MMDCKASQRQGQGFNSCQGRVRALDRVVTMLIPLVLLKYYLLLNQILIKFKVMIGWLSAPNKIWKKKF